MLRETKQPNQMTFTEVLISKGFEYNEDGDNDLMEGYVKFNDDTIEMYSEGEDDGEWNHIVMTTDGDVLVEETIDNL